MSDIRIAWQNPEGVLTADFTLQAADLALDTTLETAVLVSLFTDRRAPDDYTLPDGDDDRRGWWADAYPEIPDDQYGSRLWLLAWRKQDEATRLLAQQWAAEALQWLVDDGLATVVEVEAFYPRPLLLGLRMTIIEPSGQRRLCTTETPWP